MSTPDLNCTKNLDPHGIPKGPQPFCLMRVSAVPKKAISSWRLDTTLLCAAKKNGVEKKGQLVASTRKNTALAAAHGNYISYPGLPRSLNIFFLYASTPGWLNGFTPEI